MPLMLMSLISRSYADFLAGYVIETDALGHLLGEFTY
jgi:hypothetical protein